MRLYTRGDTRFHPTRKAPKPPSTKNDEESLIKKPEYKQRSLYQKVDTTGVLTIFLGPPILLLAVTFLVLFWWESQKAIDGDNPQAYWFRIVNADWATRLVTICTTTIRAVMVFQAGLATAMVAAVVLETKGIPLLQGPLYSVLRAVKVAPSNLFTATDFRPHLPPLIYTLVVAEVLVTAASQFLSTIYLTDFADSTFTQNNNSTNVSLIDTTFSSASGWWSMPAAASWTFGELSEPFKEEANYHDTGHTFRAFLPFDDEMQRTKLRRYQGPLPIMDHRVVCASPPLTNMTLDVRDQDYISLSGDVSTGNLSYPLLIETDTPLRINFTCRLPIPFVLDNHTIGESSLCLARSQVNLTTLNEDPLVQPHGYPIASMMFLIIDVVDTGSVIRAGSSVVAARAVRHEGPWTVVTHGTDKRTLRVSACLTNMAVQTITVGLSSSADSVEPRISWDKLTQSYNTSAPRHQLGASRRRENATERGVLTLEPRSQWGAVLRLKDLYTDEYDLPAFFMALLAALPTFMLAESGLNFSPGVLLSRLNPGFYSGNAHYDHVNMFQDTLNTTASPALAFQVLLTRIYQMAYYEELEKFKGTAVVSTAYSLTSSIPSQWTGLMIGTGLIAVHIVIVTVIAVQFLKHADNSIIGSYWQTISQIVSNETHPIFEQADRMNDEEVKRWAKRQFRNLKVRRSLRHQHNGRITLGIPPNNSEP